MELFAGRFLRSLKGPIIDLASGHEVVLHWSAAGAAADQTAWADQHAALASLRHPHLVELVDYGLIGSAQRFEALRMPRTRSRWLARDAATAAALRSVVSFLHEQGLSAGQITWDRVVDLDGRPALQSDCRTAVPCSDDLREAERQALDALACECSGPPGDVRIGGVTLQPGAVTSQIVEILETGRPGWWRCVYVRGARGSGMTTVLGLVAREARLRGFVPVSVRPLARCPGLTGLLAELHVLLIDEGGQQHTAGAHRHVLARLVVELGVANARPNVVLVARHDARCPAPTLDLTSLPPSRAMAMAAGFRPSTLGEGWSVGEAGHPYEPARIGGLSVPPLDDDEDGIGDAGTGVLPTNSLRDGPAARAESRAARGLALARRGLHAAAERVLREAVGGLARRGDGSHAGRVALSLGRLLLERGRVRDAVGAFEMARTLYAPTEHAAGAVGAAAFIGLAKTDEGRLVEGEAALRAAGIAAEQIGDRNGQALARLGLARCLHWQGRYEEARLLVDGGEDAAMRQRAIALRLSARIALARRDLPAAGTSAAAALDAARALGRPLELSSAHATMAAVQATIGDLDALKQHVANGLDEARKAHVPLRALRLRVTLLEGLAALGRRHDSRRLAARLARHHLAKVPPLLRARVQLALAESFADATRARSARHAAEAFIRTSGARALGAPRQETPSMDVIQDLIEVLRICHEAENERVALTRVCAAVRERARASAVGLFAAESADGPLSFAGHWPPTRPLVAQRAIETGLAIPPGQYGNGLEAAAPVRYGGRTVGALASRWAADVAVGTDSAAALLSTAAAACAPGVRAALDRLAVGPDHVATDVDLELIGTSHAIEEVRRSVLRAAAAPFPVLIEGESGSGKELVARALHGRSPRRDRKFCPLNCAALTDELLEAELFGHARGAFTGATGERAGLFEEADRGALFLDEVSELSARAQAKLLRVLQEGEIRRVGENFARQIDVRVVAATNRSLHAEAAAARFRRDLLYRLDVVRIVVPALRERVEDIPRLASHFWTQSLAQTASHATLEPATVAALVRYDWPGNVRELQNVMAALAVQAPHRGRVGPACLPAAVAGAARAREATLDEARRAFERRFVRATLARAAGHRGRAAADLGLSRQGLAKLLRRLELDRCESS